VQIASDGRKTVTQSSLNEGRLNTLTLNEKQSLSLKAVRSLRTSEGRRSTGLSLNHAVRGAGRGRRENHLTSLNGDHGKRGSPTTVSHP